MYDLSRPQKENRLEIVRNTSITPYYYLYPRFLDTFITIINILLAFFMPLNNTSLSSLLLLSNVPKYVQHFLVYIVY